MPRIGKEVRPIKGREDHVGGIESMVVDGRRWYFGFDYSLDWAISPLFEDPDQMAAFASNHMLQADGKHDIAYWQDLVADSVDLSAIVDNDSDRVYESETLAAQRLTPSEHLMYLMGAATAWDDDFLNDAAVGAALTMIGVPERDQADWGCIEHCIAATRSRDAEVSATARWLMARYQRCTFERLPANWPEVFVALRPS